MKDPLAVRQSQNSFSKGGTIMCRLCFYSNQTFPAIGSIAEFKLKFENNQPLGVSQMALTLEIFVAHFFDVVGFARIPAARNKGILGESHYSRWQNNVRNKSANA